MFKSIPIKPIECICGSLVPDFADLSQKLRRQGNEGGHLRKCLAQWDVAHFFADATHEDPSLLLGPPRVSVARAELESIARYFCGLAPRLTDLPVADQRQYEETCRRFLALVPPERVEKAQPTEKPRAAQPLFADASRKALKRMELVAVQNKFYLRGHPETPMFEDARIRYQRGAHDPEAIADIARVIELGAADAESIVAWRVAELRLMGVEAKAYMTAEKREYGVVYRAWVMHPDGSLEDPDGFVSKEKPPRAASLLPMAIYDGKRTTRPVGAIAHHRCGYVPEFEIRDGFWALYCERCGEYAS